MDKKNQYTKYAAIYAPSNVIVIFNDLFTANESSE